jgi:WD40 repeat protein
MSRAKWLLAVLVLAGCGPARRAPPVSEHAANPHRAPPMSDTCRASQDVRNDAAQLLQAGRLARCVRTLRAADAQCPGLAQDSWALLLECLGELGQPSELESLIRRIRASHEPPDSVLAAAERWASTKPAEDDPMALLERARIGQQQHESDAHRYLDRAVAALERKTGQPVKLDVPNGFWGGVSALAWHGDRLAVAAHGVRVLETETFKTLYELPHHHECTFLGFSDDGTRLIAGANNERIAVWDIVRRQRLFTSAYTENAHGVRLSGDNAKIMTYQNGNAVFQPLAKMGEPGPYGVVDSEAVVTADGKLAAIRNETNINVFRIRPYDDTPIPDACTQPLDEGPCWPPPRPERRPRPAFTLRSPEGSNGSVDILTFSRDGKRLAAIAGDFDVLVFDVGARRRIAKVTHDGTVLALALSDDGKRLATGAADDTARVWDVDSGRELYQTTHGDMVRAVTLSPDATRLASGSPDGTLRVSDVAAKQVLFESSPHVPRTDAIGFTPSGALLTGNSDGTVRIWTDVLGAHPSEVALRCDNSHIQALTTSLDGNLVLASTSDNALYEWSLSTEKLTRNLAARAHFMVPSSFGPDRRSIFFGDEDGSIREVRLSGTGTLFQAQATSSMGLRSIAVSHDGKTVAAGGQDHILYLIDAQTGKSRQRLEGHQWMVDQIFFTKDDQRILSRGGDFRLWDATSGASLLSDQDRYKVSVIALAPDDTSALVARDNGVTVLVALPSGEQIRKYDLHGIHPWALAFSPDGKWFVTASWQRELDIWSVTSGKHLASPRAVEGLDAGYIVTPEGQVRFVGKDQEQAKRYAACRFGDLTLDFAVCEDFLTP